MRVVNPPTPDISFIALARIRLSELGAVAVCRWPSKFHGCVRSVVSISLVMMDDGAAAAREAVRISYVHFFVYCLHENFKKSIR